MSAITFKAVKIWARQSGVLNTNVSCVIFFSHFGVCLCWQKLWCNQRTINIIKYVFWLHNSNFVQICEWFINDMTLLLQQI